MLDLTENTGATPQQLIHSSIIKNCLQDEPPFAVTVVEIFYGVSLYWGELHTMATKIASNAQNELRGIREEIPHDSYGHTAHAVQIEHKIDV